MTTSFFFIKTYSERQRKLKRYLRQHWGVSAANIQWYEKALRHKSVVGSGKYQHNDCNERLELLGDAVLDTVITEYLFNRYPASNEGHLTKIRARIVNRQTLGSVARSSGLDAVIEARIGSVDSMDKIVGNALEAWLGAIYIDRGFSVTKKCIRQFLITRYLDIDMIIEQAFDCKSKIIEWAQQQKKEVRFDTSINSNLDQEFVCCIIVDDVHIAKGTERSKKKAEQIASQLACEKLHI